MLFCKIWTFAKIEPNEDHKIGNGDVGQVDSEFMVATTTTVIELDDNGIKIANSLVLNHQLQSAVKVRLRVCAKI